MSRLQRLLMRCWLFCLSLPRQRPLVTRRSLLLRSLTYLPTDSRSLPPPPTTPCLCPSPMAFCLPRDPVCYVCRRRKAWSIYRTVTLDSATVHCRLTLYNEYVVFISFWPPPKAGLFVYKSYMMYTRIHPQQENLQCEAQRAYPPRNLHITVLTWNKSDHFTWQTRRLTRDAPINDTRGPPQGLKLCVFWHKVCSWLCWSVLCEVAKCNGDFWRRW